MAALILAPVQPKVAVIGGGPAGASFALALVGRGIDPADIVIFDKARFPRPKLCGGGVSARGTELLQRILGLSADERPIAGGVRTDGLMYQSALGSLEVRERAPQWVFDRAPFDHALLEAARGAGVAVREGVAVSALEPGVDGWRVRFEGAVETFRWVVGADGACGIARRASGLPGGRTGRLVEAAFELRDGSFRRDRLYFDFDPILEGIPGYAWVFPHPRGERVFHIGVMDARGQVPGERLRAWTRAYGERLGFRCLEPKISGWPERYFDAGTRGHRPGLLLIGEALGIDALLGEGITPALFISEHAAERLAAALHRSSDRIPGYERGFLTGTEEGRNLYLQARLAERIYGPRSAHWLRVLFRMPTLHRLAQSGDEAYGRLLRCVPALLGAYALDLLRGRFR